MKTVLLSDKTVGMTENDMVEVGDSIKVYLNDKDGLPTSVEGVVEDIVDFQYFSAAFDRQTGYC